MNYSIPESILDEPRESLCPEVWNTSSQPPKLLDDVQRKLDRLIDWAQRKYHFNGLSVFMIGSICSNSYSDNSDIDIDFCAPDATEDDNDQEVVKDFGWKFKKSFIEEYAKQFPEDAEAGSHPIEVYFSPNPFQCFMSVGCYNILEKKWEVGPEMKDSGFDPVSKYYSSAMKQADKVIEDIRDIIFGLYESAFACAKSSSQSFKSKMRKDIAKKLDDAAKLYEQMKAMRANYQRPCKSKEEALKRRKDKKQHAVDAAFKFLDKFGYISILKDFMQLHYGIEDDETTIDHVDSAVLKSVSSNMQLKHLQDSENQNDKRFLQMMQEVEHESSGDSSSKVKVWVDDVRPAPAGYVHIKSVNDFIEFVDDAGIDSIAVVDLDHDAGEFQEDGGDYIHCLDYLELIGAEDICVRLHSANPVGIANMDRIVRRNNWHKIDFVIESDLDESASSLVKMSFIAGLMAISSLLPVAALTKQLAKAKQQNSHLTVNSKETKQAIAKAAKGQKMIVDKGTNDEMSETNLVNLVAQVLWKEARGEGKDGMKAVTSVILNRTGNDPAYIVSVLKQPSAFECLIGYDDGWNNSDYKWYVPYKAISSNPANKTIWSFCNDCALQLVNKKFKSTIGNRNAYLNKETAGKKAVDSWGKKCDLQIGKQHFGYLPENDPKNVVPGTYTSWKKHNASQNTKMKTIVVKSGETLSKIAKDNNMTLAKLLELNKDIKNPNAISIGQKIRVA